MIDIKIKKLKDQLLNLFNKKNETDYDRINIQLIKSLLDLRNMRRTIDNIKTTGCEAELSDLNIVYLDVAFNMTRRLTPSKQNNHKVIIATQTEIYYFTKDSSFDEIQQMNKLISKPEQLITVYITRN